MLRVFISIFFLSRHDDDVGRSLLPTSTLVNWRHRPGDSLRPDRLRFYRSSESTEDQISRARRNLNTEAFEFLGETPPPGIHVALFLERLGKVEGDTYRVFGSGRTIDDIQGLIGSEVMRSTSFKKTRFANPCHHQLTVDFDKAKLIEAVKEKYLAGVMSTSLAFLSELQSILTGMYRSSLGTIVDKSYGLEKTQPDISRQEIFWFVGTKYWSFFMRPDIVNKILTDPAVCDILDAVKVGQSGSDLGAMIKKMCTLSSCNGYVGNIAWIAIGVPVGSDPYVLEQSSHLYGVRVLKHGEWFGKSIRTRILDIQSRLGAQVISCFIHNDFFSPKEFRKIDRIPGHLYTVRPNFNSHTKQVLRNAYNSMPPGPVGEDGRNYCFDLLYGCKTGQSTKLGNKRIAAIYTASPFDELEVFKTSTFKSADHAECTYQSKLREHGKHIRGECYSFPFEDSDIHTHLSYVISKCPSSSARVPVTISEKQVYPTYADSRQNVFYELTMIREMIIFNMISLDEVKSLLLEDGQPIIALR